LTINLKVEYDLRMSRAAPARRTNSEILDTVFGAVADATRRSILDRLRSGSLTVTELAEPYAMSLNAVSKHIKMLERAGLIRREIRGREHSCQLDAGRFEKAANWMSYYSEFWHDRMDALEKHLIDKRKRATK
jgi:DNA-binding transcriptional ArsR family regulator